VKLFKKFPPTAEVRIKKFISPKGVLLLNCSAGSCRQRYFFQKVPKKTRLLLVHTVLSLIPLGCERSPRLRAFCKSPLRSISLRTAVHLPDGGRGYFFKHEKKRELSSPLFKLLRNSLIIH